jgi:hypothetical protein
MILRNQRPKNSSSAVKLQGSTSVSPGPLPDFSKPVVPLYNGLLHLNRGLPRSAVDDLSTVRQRAECDEDQLIVKTRSGAARLSTCLDHARIFDSDKAKGNCSVISISEKAAACAISTHDNSANETKCHRTALADKGLHLRNNFRACR